MEFLISLNRLLERPPSRSGHCPMTTDRTRCSGPTVREGVQLLGELARPLGTALSAETNA